jgi:tetratricopeptide (TPR) repeat protein
MALRLLSYDFEKECYRSWFFSSTGQASEAKGQWTPDASTLTWTGVEAAPNGATMTAHDHFVNDDTIEWDVVVADKAGKVFFQMVGKATRTARPTPAQLGSPTRSVSPAQRRHRVKALTEEMMLAAIAEKPAEALAAVDKLIALEPANGDYHCGRGNFLRALGRRDEAVAAFEKSITLSENPIVRMDSWRAGVEMLTQQDKHGVVIAWCTKVIEELPPDAAPADAAALWYRRATARALTGDTANALSDLKQATELAPGLRGQAAKDAAFNALHDNADFKALTE